MIIYEVTVKDIGRFWGFVTVGTADQCWLYKSQPGRNYGNFSIGKRNISAHRFSYLIHHRTLPDHLLVLHKCDVGFCVNPAHLFLGTQLQNRQDCVAKGRQARGEQHGKSILDPPKVLLIRQRREEYPEMTEKQIADEFSVSESCINSVLLRASWDWVK